MKSNYSLLLLLLFVLSALVNAQTAENIKLSPENAIIRIDLIGLPGINYAKSKWEVSYELRIISEKEQNESFEKLRHMNDSERIGSLVGKGSFVKTNLSNPENLTNISSLPLSVEIRERLKNQPPKKINQNDLKVLENTIKKSQEESSNRIIFLLYANILVYDAKLKKNIIVPMSWIMPYERHPNAEFLMNFEITADGGYNRAIDFPGKPDKTTTVKMTN